MSKSKNKKQKKQKKCKNKKKRTPTISSIGNNSANVSKIFKNSSPLRDSSYLPVGSSLSETETDSNKIEIVAIEGNIGSKIEHFINFLGTHFTCCHPLQVTPTSISLQCLNDEKQKIFRKFKRDPQKWALSFLLHMFFEKSSYKRVLNIPSKDKQYFMINRSIISDYYCYALSFHELGYLTNEELLIYKNMIDNFHSYQKKIITKVIYLKSDVQNTYNRLLEKNNQIQFHILKKVHEKFSDLYERSSLLLPKKDIHILNLDHYEEFNDISDEKSKFKLYSECTKIFQANKKEIEQTLQNNDTTEWTTIPYKKKHKNAFYDL